MSSKRFFCYWGLSFIVIQSYLAESVDDKIEKISIGDDFDTSIFDPVKKIKNFVNIISGIGMNNLWKSQGKWIWNKSNGDILFNNFCSNLHGYNYKFFLNNLCYNFTFEYHIVLLQHFTFFIFGKILWRNYYFMNQDVKFHDLCSRYSKQDEIEQLTAMNVVVDGGAGVTNKKRIVKLRQEQDYYNNSCTSYLENKISSLSFRNFGIGVSFAWYSNLQERSKSFFVKFPLLYVSKQVVSSMCIYTNKSFHEVPSNFIRNNIYLAICGFEVGYSRFSIEFFVNVTPILDSTLCYKKHPNTDEVTIFNLNTCGIIFKYNRS